MVYKRNETRFYKIERETKIWFYDTWTRSLYTIEKDIYDEISQCLYFSENKDFFIGNIYDGIDETKINHNILINDRKKCSNCWAKYLCGGTCYYGSYVQNGNIMDIDPVECKLKKYIIEKGLELVIFFKENKIDFDEVTR